VGGRKVGGRDRRCFVLRVRVRYVVPNAWHFPAGQNCSCQMLTLLVFLLRVGGGGYNFFSSRVQPNPMDRRAIPVERASLMGAL
jgi:hypothetical protein